MSRRRTRLRAAAAVATLIGAFSLTAGAFAQADREKTPPPPATDTRQTTSPQSPAGSGGGSDQTVFRPKETIAPGKPVSFPSDI